MLDHSQSSKLKEICVINYCKWKNHQNKSLSIFYFYDNSNRGDYLEMKKISWKYSFWKAFDGLLLILSLFKINFLSL